jgi:hypothetical protein
MNNTYFLPLIRRDHALSLVIHLAAGFLVLMLVTGFSRPVERLDGDHPKTAATSLSTDSQR